MIISALFTAIVGIFTFAMVAFFIINGKDQPKEKEQQKNLPH